MTVVKTAVVCDDHPLFRSGVVNCLTENPRINIVGEASDGEACIAKLGLFKPDILIIDLSMPVLDGFQVLKWVTENQPKMRVFILSMHADLSFVKKAMALGASGFVAKEDAQSELLAAIESAPGQFYTSESVGRPPRDYMPEFTVGDLANNLRLVSAAEMKVLSLLTRSLTSREIADKLNLSVRTVQAHRVNIANKLKVKGPNKLLDLAIRHRKTILERYNAQ